MSMLKESADTLLTAVFPKTCRLCGEVIELDETLCDECKNVKKIEPPICMSCGYSKEECVCKKHKHEYKGIAAPYYYKDSVKTAVNNFKARGMTFLADGFSKDMADSVRETYADIHFDLITFVPLRNFHEHCRGFNQSALLAEGVGKELGIPVEKLLYKSRYTGVQHNKSAKERSVAVYGSFKVYREYENKLGGRTILLIDDVKTTGSTLNECAKMLKLSGADAVYALTLAVTYHK